MRAQQGVRSRTNANADSAVKGPPGVWASVSKQTSSVSTASTAASSDDENSSRQVPTFSSSEADYNSQQLKMETLPSGGIRVLWPVDARKLRSCDKQSIVSPAF